MKGINHEILPQQFKQTLEAAGQLFYEVIDNPKFSIEEKRKIGQPYVDLRNYLRMQRGQVLIQVDKLIK